MGRVVGRPFQKGRRKTGGRKKGTPDRIPRSFKASVKAVFQEIASTDRNLIRRAFRRGLKAAPPYSAKYLEMAAHYLDGKPKEVVEVQTPTPITIVMPKPGPSQEAEE